jgi:hypothetical protein
MNRICFIIGQKRDKTYGARKKRQIERDLKKEENKRKTWIGVRRGEKRLQLEYVQTIDIKGI